MEQDRKLLALLDRDPEQGMADLIEGYSGLLWSVCRTYLQSAEDIKECVNETFSEFYLYRDHFDPSKGTLKGYLAVIARRCAIRRHQENCRWERSSSPPPEEPADPFAHIEQQDELERALSALDPVDQQIIRLKYYGGLTAREIAASLGLPYETVKKRQQRSLKKLLRALSLGLLVALILAALAACAYMILRHFGFVSGYGVDSDPQAGTYILEQSAVIQGKLYEIHLEDAYWQNGSFLADLSLYGQTSPYLTPLDISLSGLDNLQPISISQNGLDVLGAYSLRLIYEGDLPHSSASSLELILTLDGTDLPITLVAAEETALEQAGFYSVTEADGGLLAVPRLENGELVVSIHPLNTGPFNTSPSLTKGIWSDYGGPQLPITVTAPDGTVLEGEPASYSPFNGDTYLDWYFGPAEPGDYVLNVPYVYQYPAAGTDSPTVQLSLSASDGAPASLSLPGGTLTLDRPFSIDDVTAYCSTISHSYDEAGYTWWATEATWEGEDPERVPAAIPVLEDGAGTVILNNTTYHNVEAGLWTEPVYDSDGQYTQFRGYVVGTLNGLDQATLSLPAEKLCYRWNHPFTISMTVQPEPERPFYTGTSGNYSLTATPRRTDGAVVLNLSPASSDKYMIPTSTLTRSPLTALGATDAPITLTAADGTVYEGEYQPGRQNDASDWNFGDIPAGDYTLHVPYLYLTAPESWHMAIPLPQQQGQVLPVGPVYTCFSGRIELSSITGIGTDPSILEQFAAAVITYPSGGINQPQEAPLVSRLDLSLHSDMEDYTLVDVGLQLFLTDEAYFSGACERQYVFEEGEPRLTSLLLRHAPGLYATDLTFTDPVLRWNHPFDIPVTIP